MKTIQTALGHLIDLLYPRLCLACQDHLPQKSQDLCLTCSYQLPKTNQHQYEENAFTERFWGKLKIHVGASYLYFSKHGIVRNLIHALKYQGQQQVGIFLGEAFGKQLKTSPHFQHIDFIIPVPLHPKKKHQRGYNQSELFGIGLANSLEIPLLTNALIKHQHTETQTTKHRMDRFGNVEHTFKVHNKEKIAGKHILLVDDVMTTGATLEACGQCLFQEGHIGKLSMATIAMANH